MSVTYNNKNLKDITTFIITVLIIILLVFNVRAKYDQTLRVKEVEERILDLDEELRIAQEEIKQFLEQSNLEETLEVYKSSQEDLGELMIKIESLTQDLGDEE